MSEVINFVKTLSGYDLIFQNVDAITIDAITALAIINLVWNIVISLLLVFFYLVFATSCFLLKALLLHDTSDWFPSDSSDSSDNSDYSDNPDYSDNISKSNNSDYSDNISKPNNSDYPDDIGKPNNSDYPDDIGKPDNYVISAKKAIRNLRTLNAIIRNLEVLMILEPNEHKCQYAVCWELRRRLLKSWCSLSRGKRLRRRNFIYALGSRVGHIKNTIRFFWRYRGFSKLPGSAFL